MEQISCWKASLCAVLGGDRIWRMAGVGEGGLGLGPSQGLTHQGWAAVTVQIARRERKNGRDGQAHSRVGLRGTQQ